VPNFAGLEFDAIVAATVKVIRGSMSSESRTEILLGCARSVTAINKNRDVGNQRDANNIPANSMKLKTGLG
jgi:hypothetical protein